MKDHQKANEVFGKYLKDKTSYYTASQTQPDLTIILTRGHLYQSCSGLPK